MSLLCEDFSNNFAENCDPQIHGVEDLIYIFRKSDLDMDAIRAGRDANNPLLLTTLALKANKKGFYIRAMKNTVVPDSTMSRAGAFENHLHQARFTVQKTDVETTWNLEKMKKDTWVVIYRNNDGEFEVLGLEQGLIVKEAPYTPTVGETRRSKPILLGSDDAFQEPYNPSVLLDTDEATTLALIESLIYAPAEISPSSLPNGVNGTPYSQTLSETGIASTVTWSVISGALPTGLTLNSSSGLISGTPSATNTFTFTVRATDGVNTAQRTYTVQITA